MSKLGTLDFSEPGTETANYLKQCESTFHQECKYL
jgi:hypothetical protein